MIARGWNGLIPGQSSLEDAIALLGQPASRFSVVGGECTHFWSGAIRITVLHGKTTISKIWISATAGKQAGIPEGLEEVQRRFGPVEMREEPQIGQRLYTGTGLKVACDPSRKPERVIWIEFIEGDQDCI